MRYYSNGNTPIFQEKKVFRSNAVHAAVGTNSMSPRTTFVIACGQATLPAIVNAANQFCADYAQAPAASNSVLVYGGPIYFSGDDAMALVRYPSGTAGVGNGVIMDQLGVIGEGPVLQTCAAGGTGAAPTPLMAPVPARSLWPQPTNRLSVGLRYRAALRPIRPRRTCPARALPSAHGACQTVLSTLSKFGTNISVYPNPARGPATVEIKDAKVGSVTVLNNLSQRISAEAKGQGQEKLQLNISALKPGLYFVQILSADGQTKIYKELVVE